MVLLHCYHRRRASFAPVCLIAGVVTELGGYYGFRAGVPALKLRVNLAACLARDIRLPCFPWEVMGTTGHLFRMTVLSVAK